MVAVYELGLDVSLFIKAIQIKPRLPENLARQIHLANPASESHRHLLPSLQRVFMKHTPLFGLLVMSHGTAVRAVRLYLGNEDLEVHFLR
jgi:hypothetical protein